MSEGTDHMLELVRSLINEESLDEDEQEAAERLVELLVNAAEIGSDEMKKMKPLLSKIDQSKRARHGLGWDM